MSIGDLAIALKAVASGLSDEAGAERPTQAEWAEEARKRGRVSCDASGNPHVLIAYQAKLFATVAANAVTVYEKSRRTGVTFGAASLAVITSAAEKSAGGMDSLYIGYNLDMAREFIDTAADWARRMHGALGEIEEFLFDDGDPDKMIKAFRISFPSGFEIVALSSKPRSLRGRQGFVIIDEAAFHDDFKALLEAALALLMWGGKILVISTHFGKSNPFNLLVEDIRAGRKPYALLRTDFDNALRDGLYERVCHVKGEQWTPEGEAQYRADIIANYGDAAQEELYCVPSEGEGSWLSAALIEARQDRGAPVIRFEKSQSWYELPRAIREADTLDWCERTLKPHLAALDPKGMYYLGGDFGRIADLSVFWPLMVDPLMKRITPFVVELRRIPFEQQAQILFYLCDRLPRFIGGALDAGGNGAYLAEVAAQRYGSGRIAQVRFSTEWYRQNMPPLKAAFEDGTISIPADRDQFEDLRLVKVINGVAMIPPIRTKGSDGGKRHGDAAIAVALAYTASRGRVEIYAYIPATADHENDDAEGYDVLYGRRL